MNEVEKQINHNNYKQIADKITQLLDKIHDSQLSSKRWVWELMQNAKDVPNQFGRVSIKIELSKDKLVFSHNGDYFKSKDITGLIQQVSSKDSLNEGDEKQTGKFGTGFITTHLLSDIIDVKGIVKNPNDGKFQRFNLRLDRSARKSEDMIDSITQNLEWVKGLDSGNLEDFPICYDYAQRTESSFDTSFIYHLNDESVKSAQVGLDDLVNTLPITMVSLPQIKSVIVTNHINGTEQVYVCNSETVDSPQDAEIIGSTISINNEKKYFLTYKTKQEDEVQVALSIEAIKTDSGYILKERAANQPVLFRDFPLIGSEEFYFPFILNGFNFDPTETRSGILLNRNEPKPRKNRAIIDKAVSSALQFNTWLISHHAHKTYLLASSRQPKPEQGWDEDYAKPWIENLQKNWRKALLLQTLLETGEGYQPVNRILIPDYGTKEQNRKFYDFLKGFVQDGILPLKDQLDKWSDVICANYPTWGENLKYTKQDFFEDLQRVGNMSALAARLSKPIEDCYIWLKGLYEFVIEQGDNVYLKKYPVIPNQEGNFCLLESLRSDSDKRIPSELKVIAVLLLKKDLKNTLLDEHIDDSTLSMTAYNLDNLVADINTAIDKSLAVNGFTDSEEWKTFGKGVYDLLSLMPNSDQDAETRRKMIYDFVSHFAPLTPQLRINDLPASLWSSADKFIIHFVPDLISGQASTLDELGGNMLVYPSHHDKVSCVSWINDYDAIVRQYNMAIPQSKAIYPNQKGVLCKLSDLHYDDAIPEEIKDLYIVSNGSDVRNDLLDKGLKGFEAHDKKTTANLYDSIKERFESPYTSDSLKMSIARKAIALIPPTQADANSDNRLIYQFAKLLYNELDAETVISSGYGFNWEKFSAYILDNICKNIAESVNVGKLSELIKQDEDKAIDFVDNVIVFINEKFGKRYVSYVDSEHGVWLNQNGDFYKKDDIYKDDNIDERLKDLALNRIVDTDYKERLLRKGMRCESYLQLGKKLSSEDLLKDIDSKIKDHVNNKRSLQDTDFADLIFRLDAIVKGNDSYKDYVPNFINSHDRLIVGSIGDERTLSIVGSLVSNPDKLEIIDALNKFDKDKLQNILNKINDDSDRSTIVMVKDDNDAEVSISLSDTPYAGLTQEQMSEALLEAKKMVESKMEAAGYTFTEGLCENQYGDINGVMKDGQEYPLVVHSYKSTNRPFQLTAFDWKQLSKKNSILWVNTYNGLKCVPFYLLAKDKGTINVSFSAENFEVPDRCRALAKVLQHYKGLHFNFGSMIPDFSGNIELFNKLEKPIEEVLVEKEDSLLV